MVGGLRPLAERAELHAGEIPDLAVEAIPDASVKIEVL
jgi:hypothetical protein